MILRQLNDVRMNPFTLAFSGGFEQGYRADFLDRSFKHVQIALILAAVIYASCGLLDGPLDLSARPAAWTIRFAIVSLILFCLLLQTFVECYKRYYLHVIACLVAICGIGLVYVMSLSVAYERYLFPGVLLVIVYGVTFSRLRFIQSTGASFSILASYEYFAVFSPNQAPAEFWSNSFHISVLVVIGMVASYHLELYARRDYLQKLIIAEERRKSEELKLIQEKERIVKNLHDGIGGIITNINLLSEMDHSGEERKGKTLHTISDLSGECLNEIRTFINVCADHEKTWRAMFAEMRHFGCSMLESHAIIFQFHVEGVVDSLISDSLTAINLMRIYREALANIVKHAGADKVFVEMTVEEYRLKMVVHDNGVWRQQRDQKYTGCGLTNMDIRTTDMGGEFTIDTSAGTRIQVSIPLGAS